MVGARLKKGGQGHREWVRDTGERHVDILT